MSRAALRTVAALLAASVVTGCSAAAQEPPAAAPVTQAPPAVSPSASPPAVVSPSPVPGDDASPQPDSQAAPAEPRAAVQPVASLSARLRPDVLVTRGVTISDGAVARLAALAPEGRSVVFRAGKVRIAGKAVSAVGVDPSQFRAFSAEGTAESDPVWQSVARGEAVVAHAAAKTLRLELGGSARIAAGATGVASPLRVGAFASTGLPGADLVVDDATGRRLGLRSATGVLLSAADGVDPVALARQVRAITGTGAQVDLLTPPTANPVAFLTGSKAADAFGAFSYRYFADGTIQPDASWVRDNIRTEMVPIMGRVTCHRLMLPQLRGALQEVVDRGLRSSLTTYDGCYVPRFIERNPERSISLHTWGIAIDMDASTNYRGIRGTMHPEVVAIFKRWGFRWGGDWSYTDPMHFEMGAILSSPS